MIVKVCSPSGNLSVVIEYEPSEFTIIVVPNTSPEALVITTVAPTSPIPVIVGVLSLVILSVFDTPVSLEESKSALIVVELSNKVSTFTYPSANLKYSAFTIVSVPSGLPSLLSTTLRVPLLF